ncbi:hypothetical protein BASA81_001301 [Batrachochytrium salamandrivorans]|nr:hypothetical protein BASA81_001301 [Batrachochytrium salamandrivorans]
MYALNGAPQQPAPVPQQFVWPPAPGMLTGWGALCSVLLQPQFAPQSFVPQSSFVPLFSPQWAPPPAVPSAQVKRARLAEEDLVPPKAKRNRKPRGPDGDSEPNGETRLDIKFTSFGSLPANPEHVQRWGRKGVIPDGLAGRFTFYGEDWAFWTRYRELRTCSDGVERHLVEFGIRHKHWEVSETETEKQCRDRHQKGYTICNSVFALALDQRAREYQDSIRDELQREFPNDNHIKQCQSRVDKLVPKRVSEGPLLFGLRHKAVRDAMASSSEGE